MKTILSKQKLDCEISIHGEAMAAVLYDILRGRGLLANDEGYEPHPNFAMTSPLMRRLIQNTSTEFIQRLNISVNVTQ